MTTPNQGDDRLCEKQVHGLPPSCFVVVAETDASGNITAKYIRGLNLIASTDANGANIRHYLYNAHGDTTQLTDSAGNVIINYDYDAFGNEKNPSASDTNPFRYCGEYTDLETNNIYLRNRYYAPSSGRFLTEDPARSGNNWYSYAGNNPVKYADPMGLWDPNTDPNRSQQAQVYLHYYTDQWNAANQRFQNATTDAERAAAQTDMDAAGNNANNIRILDGQGLVTGNSYDVALFSQGGFNLCWAYSQTMIENFNAGGGMTQAQADARAQAISQSVHGTNGQNANGGPIWDQGGWPTNSQDVTNQVPNLQTINSFADLSALLANGPVYGYYNNAPQPNNNVSAHLIVITGAVSATGHPDLVTTNNPWGDANIQTYNDFLAGIPRDTSGMRFIGALRQ